MKKASKNFAFFLFYRNNDQGAYVIYYQKTKKSTISTQGKAMDSLSVTPPWQHIRTFPELEHPEGNLERSLGPGGVQGAQL